MEQSVNTIIITQARTGSSRLPGKVLKQIKQREQNLGIIIPVLGSNLLQKTQ
jgi:spore coat polysaccharide biosynthesis protein SpsF (cytidylyltransferase family)